jgi:hypothetical protein
MLAAQHKSCQYIHHKIYRTLPFLALNVFCIKMAHFITELNHISQLRKISGNLACFVLKGRAYLIKMSNRYSPKLTSLCSNRNDLQSLFKSAICYCLLRICNAKFNKIRSQTYFMPTDSPNTGPLSICQHTYIHTRCGNKIPGLVLQYSH